MADMKDMFKGAAFKTEEQIQNDARWCYAGREDAIRAAESDDVAGQSRRASAVEVATSTAIGFTVAVVAQKIILPLFGLYASTGEHLGIAVLFTIVSIVRGYAVRRLFNALGRGRNE